MIPLRGAEWSVSLRAKIGGKRPTGCGFFVSAGWKSIEKANLREGNVNQGDLEIFCALNLDFVVEPTCGIGAQLLAS